MAHAISTINQQAAIAIRAGKPAWHGLGKPLQGNETVADALALSSMAWGTYSQRISVNDQLTDHKAICRDFDNRVLGITKLSYAEVDHKAHIASIESLVTGGYGGWDCLASLNDGRRYFATIQLDGQRIAGDDYQQYINVSGSYDGSLAASCRATRVRVVCANTLSTMLSAQEGCFRVVHKGQAQQRIVDAGNLMARALEAFDGQAAKLEQLRTKAITSDQFRAIVESCYRVKKVREQEVSPALTDILAGGLSGGGSLAWELLNEQEKDKRSRTVDILSELYETAPGACPGSAYGALQAVTYYDTHGRGRTPDARVNGTLLGSVDRVEQILELVSLAP